MNSKQRIKMAFMHEEPDRVPVYADFVPEVTKQLLKHFNTDDYNEMTIKLGNDMIMVNTGIVLSTYGLKDEYVDSYGLKWKYFENDVGKYAEVVERPLEDDSTGAKLASYKLPDVDYDSVILPARNTIKKYGKDYWITSWCACSIFETAWLLHGLEDTLCDMACNPEYAHALFDMTMKYALNAGLSMIDEGVDMVWLGDDVGMQHTMMMPPDLWRTFLKPRLATLISAFKEKKPGIVVAYHSCGYIVPIIDDLIEIGVDVLNPIQPLAMDPSVIAEQYGDKINFWGGICVQQTLPFGTEQQIRDEVLLRVKTLGKNGGYLLSPAHTVQADTSLENVLAFYKAAKELTYY